MTDQKPIYSSNPTQQIIKRTKNQFLVLKQIFVCAPIFLYSHNKLFFSVLKSIRME